MAGTASTNPSALRREREHAVRTQFARLVGYSMLSVMGTARAVPPAMGAAPDGDAIVVATRIIKRSFPACARVSQASRGGDGAIRAKCDGTDYLVFTVFIHKEKRTVEAALNCAAARDLIKVSC